MKSRTIIQYAMKMFIYVSMYTCWTDVISYVIYDMHRWRTSSTWLLFFCFLCKLEEKKKFLTSSLTRFYMYTYILSVFYETV